MRSLIAFSRLVLPAPEEPIMYVTCPGAMKPVHPLSTSRLCSGIPRLAGIFTVYFKSLKLILMFLLWPRSPLELRFFQRVFVASNAFILSSVDRFDRFDLFELLRALGFSFRL